MNVQIPIAGLTLSDGQTYNGQLPVWATRPLMLRVLPDFISGDGYSVYIRVTNGGAIKKEITLPYQEIIYLDLSFAAPLLRRADRNTSEGDPMFPQQSVEIWSSNPANKITLPVFHCDETYWDTLGVDSALPQPPKPRIPGQTLDIYFPYRIHPLDAFQVEVEPVTGAPSDVIFPATYVLGNTIDIKYIKKLTIKNVWGPGLDQVINYEDKLHTDVIYDESMQCALRARWNMRNGQWFWAAFKDYFWSNKFTAIRGRGGVTEQAELTINLEYGEEWYNVYQELLVSSNVVFDLNIPGINQYQNKRFRAEVMGDTGARWSNSTKTYRQQVRFRTTELTDNYMFPPSPDQPPTPSIQFSAQVNPWVNGSPGYMEGMWNNIYSNAAWEVQSKPDWYAFGDMITLTPDDFESGQLVYAVGTNWETWKQPNPAYIRLKNPIVANNKTTLVRISVPGYTIQGSVIDANGLGVTATNNTNSGEFATMVVPAGYAILLRLNKSGYPSITPNEATAAQLGVSDNSIYTKIGKAGTQYIYGTIATNTGEARSGNIVLKSKAGANTFTFPITQAKASISLNPANVQVSNGVQIGRLITEVTANTPWEIVSGYPSWITPTSYSGAPGTSQMFVDIQANAGAQRTAFITLRSTINTSVTQVLSVYQEGATGNITATPSTIAAGYVHLPVTIDVMSFGNWSVSARDTWITPNRYAGPNGLTEVTLTIADNNTNDPRTENIVFYNDLTGQTAVVTVNQAGAPSSIALGPTRVTAPKTAGTVKRVVCGSTNGWTVAEKPSWVAVAPNSDAAGIVPIGITYTANSTGTKRSGYLKVTENVTGETAICIIEQEG